MVKCPFITINLKNGCLIKAEYANGVSSRYVKLFPIIDGAIKNHKNYNYMLSRLMSHGVDIISIPEVATSIYIDIFNDFYILFDRHSCDVGGRNVEDGVKFNNVDYFLY